MIVAVDVSYHGVHGEVVVLGLQLHSVLVTPANLCVTLQEHFLVVADPVEHLHTHTHTQMLYFDTLSYLIMLYWALFSVFVGKSRT